MYKRIVGLFFILCSLLISGCGSNGASDGAESVPSLALSEMSVTTERNVLYPAFDSDVLHYAASCGDGGIISLVLSSLNQDAEIYVNNTKTVSGQSYELSGLAGENDIVVALTEGVYSQKYYIHCISEELPVIDIVKKTSQVDDGFLVMSPRIGDKSYLLIIDNNAVPRFRRVIDGRVTDFKQHGDGRYSYALRTTRNEFGQWDNEIVVLDAHFQEEKRLTTVGLNHTDNHEFLITPQGSFVLASYNSSYRDLSPWGLSENELTRDSVVQELNLEGEVIFEWNSWDGVDISNCLNHRFPDDYAHINSMQVAPDGNLVLSLRGCSQILKIDRVSGSGDTIWELGGATSTFQIVGDSFEEFCGQHTASEDADGNIYIFDNGGHCNGAREGNYGLFSRALKYSLDIELSQADFVRDYSLYGTYSEYTLSGGSFFPTKNGNWLINWSKGVNDITEVSPDDSVALQLTISSAGEPLSIYRAHRAYDIDLPINLDNEVTFERFSN